MQDSEAVLRHLSANLKSIFHAAPGVKHSPVCLGHRKVATPATSLIMCPTDGNIAIVTEEECADSAVPNEEHIAFMLPAENRLRLAHDADLGIDRTLPAAYALIWMSKEFIGHACKFDWCQKARR